MMPAYDSSPAYTSFDSDLFWQVRHIHSSWSPRRAAGLGGGSTRSSRRSLDGATVPIAAGAVRTEKTALDRVLYSAVETQIPTINERIMALRIMTYAIS